MTPIDWRWLMGVGLGLLRLPPAQFWAMSPRELSAAMDVLFGNPSLRQPLGRGDLAALMARYPDRMEEDDG